MENDSRRVVEDFINCYNRKDIDSMLNLLADDIQYEYISNSNGITTQASSKEQFREISRMAAENYEDRQLTAIHWVMSENSVAVETELWCRLAKDLPNGLKAGEGLRLKGATFFIIENGLIKRLVDYQ